MKAYLSYVVQDKSGHKHDSTFIEVTYPPYKYSMDPQAAQVLDWAKSKQTKLKTDQKIIITSMHKV